MGEGTASKDQIIDGQQRLTTLNLMLIAIRDVAKQLKKNNFDEVLDEIDDFLTKYRGDSKTLRLTFANQNSNDVYEAIVESKNYDKYNSKIQDRFIKNYIYINSLVKEYVGKGRTSESRLKDLFKRICSLQLIFIKCVDKSSAFRLFESINATGVDLSTNDLIKNSIFEKLFTNKSDYEAAEKEWRDMFTGFQEDSSALKTYIRHHWIATVDYTSHSKLFDDFLKKYKDRAGVAAYSKSLTELSYTYRALRNGAIETLDFPSRGRNDLSEIKNNLIFLSALRVDQVYPVLMKIYMNEPDKLKGDLVRLSAFQFLFKYVPGSPSAAEKIFANYCTTNLKKKIDKNKMYQELIKLCKNKKEDFIKKYTEKIQYSGTSNPDTQFILEKYMFFYGKPAGFTEPTIEHIIPQDKSDPIYNLLSKDSKENANLVNSIGNLTILEKYENSSDKLYNTAFFEKYALYRTHAFKVNNKISKYKFDINPKAAINKRGNDIASDVYDIFFSALQNGKWPKEISKK